MNVEDMIMISVDDHVVEPPHVFEGRLPGRSTRTWRPRSSATTHGDDVWAFNGGSIPNIGLNAVAGRPKEEYGVDPTSFDEMRRGCWDIHERVKDMSAGGVLGMHVLPVVPVVLGRVFAGVDDKDLAAALVRAYNDWHIDEWCGSYPGRHIPMALPMLWDPAATAAEVRRVAAKGCHSLTFTENPATLGLPELPQRPLGSRCGTRSSTTGTVLNVHLGSSGQLAVTAPDAPMDVMITLQPMNICMAAADLVWSRVFKKYRELRVALSEGGTGWIPYFLDRLDRTYDMHHLWTRPGLRRRAAERRVPPALPHVLHRRSGRHPAPRRHRHRQHLLGAGLPALRLVVAARTRGAAPGRDAVRRARRRPRQDHPRERDALVPVRSVRASRPRRSARSARCARRSPVTT